MALFQGAATALVTPFKKGKVDMSALERIIDFQLKGGIKALIINGTTGEPTTMSHSERTAVLKKALEMCKGKIPVIAGTGSNNTHTAILYSREAEELGADAILVVTPYYNKTTQAGLVAHYKAVADSVNTPLFLYNVPARTGLNIQPETAAKLAGYKNIVAIKEASGNIDQLQETARLTQGKMDVYSGEDALVLPTLAAGGLGVVSVAANVIPSLMVKLCDAFFAGDVKKCRELQFKVYPLVKTLFSETSPIPVKYAMWKMGLIENELRLPLVPMENTARMDKNLEELGLI